MPAFWEFCGFSIITIWCYRAPSPTRWPICGGAHQSGMPTGEHRLFGKQGQWKCIFTKVQHRRSDSEHRAVVVPGPHGLIFPHLSSRLEQSRTEHEISNMQLLHATVFSETLAETVDVCSVSPPFTSHAPLLLKLHTIYTLSMQKHVFCASFWLYWSVSKKEKSSRQWVPVYILYIFSNIFRATCSW